jgi:hypothetical protein
MADYPVYMNMAEITELTELLEDYLYDDLEDSPNLDAVLETLRAIRTGDNPE